MELEVQRIRGLVKDHRFGEAVTAAQALRSGYPENRDVLYLLALAQRQARRITDALDTLADMERHHPGFQPALSGTRSLLRRAQGCFCARSRRTNALVQINPAATPAWSMLEGLYGMAGDDERRQRAATHVARLKSMPPEVLTATGMFCEGDLVASERLIRAFLLTHGNHVEAMRLLARIGIARDILDDAEVLLAGALAMAPDYIELRRDLACVMLDRHKHAESIAELDKLLALDPKNIDYRTLHATATVGLGNHEGGIRGFTSVLADIEPQSRLAADLHLSIAHAQKTLGRRAESIEAYKHAIKVRPRFGDAYWSLANLKTYQFSDAEIAEIETAEADPATDPLDRYHLCFALGKAYEDRAEYARSWQFYERGNALGARHAAAIAPDAAGAEHRPPEAILHTRILRRANQPGRRQPRSDLHPRHASCGLDAARADPCLAFTGRGDAGARQRTARSARPAGLRSGPEQSSLSRMPGQKCQRSSSAPWARSTMADTRIYRTGEKLHFIDKMPDNWRHIGLIHLMLPNARIIDARREPMACCFGNLKQLYARGQEFAYSVDDIARYYRTYLELMAHWDAALPGRVLRVHHEDVVDDLEGSVRRTM